MLALFYAGKKYQLKTNQTKKMTITLPSHSLHFSIWKLKIKKKIINKYALECELTIEKISAQIGRSKEYCNFQQGGV